VTLTVTNDGGVDNKCQKSLLVGSSVVLQQSSGIIVADRDIGRALSNRSANGSRDSKSLEKHDERCRWLLILS
jgi:hypothetical protein